MMPWQTGSLFIHWCWYNAVQLIHWYKWFRTTDYRMNAHELKQMSTYLIPSGVIGPIISEMKCHHPSYFQTKTTNEKRLIGKDQTENRYIYSTIYDIRILVSIFNADKNACHHMEIFHFDPILFAWNFTVASMGWFLLVSLSECSAIHPPFKMFCSLFLTHSITYPLSL